MGKNSQAHHIVQNLRLPERVVIPFCKQLAPRPGILTALHLNVGKAMLFDGRDHLLRHGVIMSQAAMSGIEKKSFSAPECRSYEPTATAYARPTGTHRGTGCSRSSQE